jgi:YD repeat-containing protein
VKSIFEALAGLASLRVRLFIIGVAWTAAASAITGIEVPLSYCTTSSGVPEEFPPYYGGAGPSPTDWEAATQLSCIRFAAAHRTCFGGAPCNDGTVCSTALVCNRYKPPFTDPQNFPRPGMFTTAVLTMHDNLASCEDGTSPAFAAGTCNCPTNASMLTDGRCYCNDGHVLDASGTSCIPCPSGLCPPDIDPGKNCADCPPFRGDMTGGSNPINVGIGMKIERDVVYRPTAGDQLAVGFVFTSTGFNIPLPYWVGLFGRNRTSPFDRMVRRLGVLNNQDRISLVRPDGRRLEFRGPTDGSNYAPDADIEDRVERLTPAGWRVTTAQGDEVEYYDGQAQQAAVLSVVDRSGRTMRFSYADGQGGIRFASGSPNLGFSFTAPACSPPAGWVYQLASNGTNAGTPSFGRLLCVTDHWGRQLHFQHNVNGQVTKIADPENAVYQFNYDGASGGCSTLAFDNAACTARNLTSIVFPDTKVRTYHYNELAQINNGTQCPNVVAFSPGRGHLPWHLTSLQDENGAIFAKWMYGCGGRAIGSEHAGGANKITITYDSQAVGNRTVTDYRLDVNTPNQSRDYTFQSSLGVARNTGVNQPCDRCPGASSEYTYDINGNVSSRTDFNGNRTNYSYDLARNLETSRTEGLTSSGGITPQTRTTTTEWDTTFRLPTKVAEPLRITTNVYDPDGSLCGARGALRSRGIQATSDTTGSQGVSATPTGSPRTWAYTYNSSGNVLTINGPRTDVADITTYTYYDDNHSDRGKRGNVATITNAAGHPPTSITAYNIHRQPLTIVDPNGLTIELTYDERQRLKTRKLGSEPATVYEYDGVGQLTKVTLPDSTFLSYFYDDAHRLTRIEDNLGNRITYSLDLLGNRTVEEVRDPQNLLVQTRTRAFNNLGRLVQEIGAENQTTEYTYKPQGNVATIKDPLTQETTYEYDALNRLRQVAAPQVGSPPASPVTQYAYNGLDALVQVTDPRNLVTSYTVDGLGNLMLQHSPDTGDTINCANQIDCYDAAGNLKRSFDAKGQRTDYQYDALNRVTQIEFRNVSQQLEAKQTYVYDQNTNGIGRLSSITETNAANQVTSVIAYLYDQHGRVTSETRTLAGVPYVFGYHYDSVGRLDQLTYPSTRTVTYTFDGLGRVKDINTLKAGGQVQTVVSGVAYHPLGTVKGYTLGNLQTYERTVDLDGRIKSYTLGGQTGQTFEIRYDLAGRIDRIRDRDNPTTNVNTYVHDGLDRLTNSSISGTPYEYRYDATGNRLSRTAGSTQDYTISSSSNQILSITPSRTFVHDANGSTTADGINTYGYDARGRMTQATSTIGLTNYQINALGQRVRKWNSLGDTIFHYDNQGRLIAETDPAGNLKRELIYLGDIPVGVVQ